MGISKVCKDEIEFRANEEIHTLLDMTGILPPIFLTWRGGLQRIEPVYYAVD
jgi:hypothetical protein